MIRLALRVPSDRAELVLAELLELCPAGVEEVELAGGVTEYAVYGAPGELPTLPSLQAAAGDALVEVSGSEIPDDWADRWREFHRPLKLGSRLMVRPPWEPPDPGCQIDVVIDPGQAFGTGSHPTTRLCLELMLSLAAQGSFLDVGCGSGVLAIAAAKLGWTPVVALDFDAAAVEATERNAAINQVELDVRRHDLRHGDLPRADLVGANLLAPLLLELARHLETPPERLITSGLLEGEEDRVTAALAACGLREAQRRRAGGWSTLLLARRRR